jgi:hypothetical protein
MNTGADELPDEPDSNEEGNNLSDSSDEDESKELTRPEDQFAEILAELPQEELKKLLAGPPENRRANIRNLVRTHVSIQSYHHSGPLPPSGELKRYNELIDKGAERIMRLTEKQQDHRISIER